MKAKLAILLVVLTTAGSFFIFRTKPYASSEQASGKASSSAQAGRKGDPPSILQQGLLPREIASEAPTFQSSWLEEHTLSVLVDRETNRDGYRSRTRILETSFHKPLIRSETRYVEAGGARSQTPVFTSLSVANEFIAKLAPGAVLDEISLLAASVGALAYPIAHNDSLARIVFPVDSDLDSLLALSESLEVATDLVRFVEPDFLLGASATYPDDPRLGEQLGLNDSHDDHDIDAPEAWSIAHDAPEIVVAVIDSGMRVTHEDLAANLWENNSETANGMDDDGNGVIDDLNGFNAIADNGEISDDNGHGTHVAGIIGARGNNGRGISGVAWQVQLMPLKFLDSSGFGTTSDAIECISYAIKQKVDIINNSWGGSSQSDALYDTLKEASSQGILIVTAAGNKSQDLEVQPSYPASYRIPNQIVVVAMDRLGRRASYSNQSALLSHIAAPGRALSTYFGSDDAYAELEGTSMAAPLVSGALALIKTMYPELNAGEIANRLLDSVQLSANLSGICLSEGQLNIHRALSGMTNAPPNDNFADATIFPIDGGRANGSTTGASLEPGEALARTDSGGRTVWHKWIPYRDGNARAILSPVGFAGSLAVFEGDALSSLRLIDLESASLSNESLTLDLELTSGTSYYFQIDARALSRGPYSLELALASENDAFSNATELEGEQFSVLATNRAADVEQGESPVHPSAAGASVWFNWTAPVTGDFYLRPLFSESPMFCAVFTGDSLDMLEPIDSTTETGNTGNLLFHAEQGVAYRIAVDSLLAAGSKFRLEGSYLKEPRIISQPSSLRLSPGGSARFFVSVFGPGEPIYQWLKDGSEIQGATSDTLILPNVVESDFASYQVRIQIAGYTLLSKIALLDHLPLAIRFAQNPNPQSITEGNALTLSAVVSGAGSGVSFQWIKNGNPLLGQTKTFLQIENAQPSDSGFYTLRATKGASLSDSLPAYVLVSSGPVPNGFSWTSLASSPSFGNIHIVGDYYVADLSDRIGFSIDGYHWQYLPNEGRQIAYHEGFYYTANEDGIYRSDNMANWDIVYESDTGSVGGIVSGNGVLLCHVSRAVLRSTDGIEWSETLSIGFNSIGHISFGGGHFVVREPGEHFPDENGLTWKPPSIHVSEDGLIWGTPALPEGDAFHPIYGADRWWLQEWGSGGTTYTSTDAQNWEAIELPFKAILHLFADPVLGDTYLIGKTEDSERHSQSFVDLYRFSETGFEFIRNISHGYFDEYAPMVAKNGEIIAYPPSGARPLAELGTSDFDTHRRFWWQEARLSQVNGKFLAEYNGDLRSSFNGTDWTFEATGETPFGGIVYGNGLYVGPNHYGAALASLETHNWGFSQVAYGNNVFVGSGQGRLLYSSDGQSWSETESDIGTTNRIVFGGGVFVSYADSVYRSTNGIQWSLVSLEEGIRFRHVTYGNGRFVAFDESNGKQSYTSTDGANWSRAGVLSGGSGADYLAYYGEKFHVLERDYASFESVDGAQWTELPFSTSMLGYNSSLSYAPSSDALLVGSPLGIAVLGSPPSSSLNTQIASPSKQVTTQAGNPITIAFDSTATLSPLFRSEVYVSGQLWTTLGSNEYSFTYEPESPGSQVIKIVSFDEAGNSSEDSLTVTVAPSVHTFLPSGQFRAHDILYHKGAFYAASDGGRIYVSTDGVKWKGIQTPTVERVTSLAASDSAIVATHDGVGVLYSSNGIDWLKIGSFGAGKVTFEGTVFVVGSETPIISPDGLSWTNAVSGESLTGTLSRFSEDRFIFNTSDSQYDYPLYGQSYVYNNGRNAARIQDMRKVLQIGEAYVGLNSDGTFYSEDLQAWNDVSPSNDYFEDIELLGGILFLKTTQEITHLSGDGKHWIKIEENFANKYLSYNNGYYYAIAYERVNDISFKLIRSSNGIDWVPYGPYLVSGTYSPRFSGLAASPVGVIITSENNGESLHFVTESGLEPVSRTDDNLTGDNLKLVGPNGAFALTDHGSFRIESDGKWTRAENGIPYVAVYANGIYLAESDNGRYRRSVDGENWTELPVPGVVSDLYEYPEMNRFFSEGDAAIWAEAVYTIINQDGYSERRYVYIRTTDGLSWQLIGLPEGVSDASKIMGFKGDAYFFQFWGDTNTVYRAREGSGSWESYPVTVNRSEQIATTKSLIGALNSFDVSTRKLDVSSDGTTWNSYDLPTSGYLELVATDDAFYLLGDQVWKSANGQDWELYAPYQLRASAAGNRIVFYGEDYVLVEPATNDLAVAHASLSSKAYGVGDSFKVEVTLVNSSETRLDWNPGEIIEYTFSSNPGQWSLGSIDPGFAGSATIPFTSLSPGESKSFEFETTVPSGIRPNTYYLSVYLAGDIIPKDGNRSNDFFTRTEATPLPIPGRTLLVSPASNGTISGLGVRSDYAWKEKVLLTAIPDFGYLFDGWSGDIEYAEETLLVTMDTDISLTASFSPKTFELEVSTSGKGSVTGIPSSQSIYFGEDLNLSAIPEEGWIFIAWDGYGQSSSESLSAKVGRNLAITARFGQLFSGWARSKYGDDPTLNDPQADADGDGITNMEHFALGFDYPEQRAAANLGYRLEGDVLILRYATYRGLFDLSATPVWSDDALSWKNTDIIVSKVGESEDLTINEARFSLSQLQPLTLLSIRISEASIN